MAIDILIIAATKNNSLKRMTQNAINSCHNSGGDFNIVVIETHNKEAVYDYASMLYCIQDATTFNYNRTINFGLKRTTNQYVGFFNNDVVFREGWAKELLECMEESGALSASPRNPANVPRREQRYITGYEVSYHVSGWAIVINRKLLDRISYLDEGVQFWFSDNIYVRQLKKHNIKHILCVRSIVDHIVSRTLTTLDDGLKNKLTFRQQTIYKPKIPTKFKFSVIMPVYLGVYKGGASDRETKFIRAVDSVLRQTLKSWELIIISDGCERTIEIYLEKYAKYSQVKCLQIPKQVYLSGQVRSAGISKAIGKYIIYLDSDDYYLDDHLQRVNSWINGFDWIYYNDNYKQFNKVMPKNVKLHLGSAGTSCICHLKSLGVDWKGLDGYTHDFRFIERVRNISGNYKKGGNSGYVVCHTPGGINE